MFKYGQKQITESMQKELDKLNKGNTSTTTQANIVMENNNIVLNRYVCYHNKTSAIENCETSAIGRALASCGLHGGQYASVDEIIKAKNNEINIDNNNLDQETKPDPKVDWTLYIAKQQEAITRMKTLTALSSWTNNEAKNLENLAAADKPKWTALFNFWSARNEEIKNG